MTDREYLDATVVPTILHAMAETSKQRPDMPVSFLIEYLEQNNNERSGGGKGKSVSPQRKP